MTMAGRDHSPFRPGPAAAGARRRQCSWVTISSGASGTGDGTVRFTASRNTGPSRSGAITAAGKTFTVSQGNGCSIALASTTFNAPAAGGSGTVGVTAGGGCSWTATSNANWLSIASGAAGTGNGTVGFTVAANNGPPRSDTLTIGGRTFTVSQAENCSFTIAPERVTMSAAAGDTNVAVTTASGCPWVVVERRVVDQRRGRIVRERQRQREAGGSGE